MDLSHGVEWSLGLGLEPWSGVLRWILEWNIFSYCCSSWTGVGSDSPVPCQCLLLRGTFVLFPLLFLPCVAHIRQSRFEYLFHNH